MCVVRCSKKYQIEQMEGEKVVSRSRGFTVDSCVSAVLASQETPEFNGLPTGEKVRSTSTSSSACSSCGVTLLDGTSKQLCLCADCMC